MLDQLKKEEGVKPEEDRVGGFGPLASGVYPVVIELAYLDESSGGAMNINFVFKTQDGKTLRQTIYVTSGKAKGQKTYYEKDGEKHYLPGFNVCNTISQMAIGKELGDLSSEEKVLKLYDFTQRKEVPQKKQVLMELLGKDALLGVTRCIQDKNVKDANGNYVPSGETRMDNEIEKVFHPGSGLTAAEIRSEATKAEFMAKWKEQNDGKDRDKSTKGASAPAAGAAPANQGGGSGKLFDS